MSILTNQYEFELILEDKKPKKLKNRKIRNKITEHRRNCYICGLPFDDEPIKIEGETCKISIHPNCKLLIYPVIGY